MVRDQILKDKGIRFVHVFGDIAYANGNQPVWDGYGRDMERLLSRTPGIFSPGNHDGEFEFGNSYNRAGEGGGDSGVSYALRNPGPGPAVQFNSSHTGPFSSTSLYWSVDEGPVHLVAVAGVLGFEPGTLQYEWLEADLKAAARADNRAVRPWIVVTDHYPAYCTINSCNTGQPIPPPPPPPPPGGQPPGVLTVTPERTRRALEPLLLKYQVDAMFVGHNHNFERTHPVADLVPTTFGEPGPDGKGTLYRNPGAPVHWVVGTGGADPDPVSVWASTPPWLASRLYNNSVEEATNWGWVRVEANSTCLHAQFMNAFHNTSGTDRVWITK